MKTPLLISFAAFLMLTGAYVPEQREAQSAASQQPQEPVCKLCPTITVQCLDSVSRTTDRRTLDNAAGYEAANKTDGQSERSSVYRRAAKTKDCAVAPPKRVTIQSIA
jgi:hypothetical protein